MTSKHLTEINGNTIEWSKEESQSRCICGHSKLAHVHFNGDMYMIEGHPTYCGFPLDYPENGRNCDCSRFRSADKENENN